MMIVRKKVAAVPGTPENSQTKNRQVRDLFSSWADFAVWLGCLWRFLGLLDGFLMRFIGVLDFLVVIAFQGSYGLGVLVLHLS